MSLDLFFCYNTFIRFLILQKINKILNSYGLPEIYKLKLQFIITKISVLDASSFYNCAYLFRYFLGKSTYFSNLISEFGFNESSHSFKISCDLKDKIIKYSIIFFLLNDILPYLPKAFIKSFFFNYLKFYLFSMYIMDVNIFSEKKTNLGLFSLEDPLIFTFYLKCNTREDAMLFMSILGLI